MPLSEEARDKLCAEAINQILFDKVWNEPFSEFRVNIKPYFIGNGSIVGSFTTDLGTVLLPTPKESYFLWGLPVSDFNVGLQLPTGKWISLDDIAERWSTLIHVYHSSGAMFNKSTTYLRYDGLRQTLHLAVLKRMAMTMLPAWQAVKEVYMTIYYDSDHPKDIRIFSAEIPTEGELDDFKARLDEVIWSMTDLCQYTVFMNGIEVTETSPYRPVSLDRSRGQFVDVIVDKNIAWAFDVELTTTRENPVFLSDMDSTWKQLIHIPKDLNPSNKVITHNTCDIYVRRKLSETTHGRYLHRAAGKRSVSQVTHNDLAIPLFVLDAYRDYLQAQEIKLRVVCRIHDKDNYLLQDASYINMLYSSVHSDEQIIDILVGKGPSQIPWWKASELEKSPYVQMFFNTPNVATITHMKEYVDALGFYHVVNLLCRRVNETIVTDNFQGLLTFGLPLLYTGMKVTPVVYLNGKAIYGEYVTYSNHNDGTVTVQLSDDVRARSGDRIAVIFYVDGDRDIFEYQVTENNLSFDVPYDDACVYLKHFANTAMSVGISGSSTVSYSLLGKNDNHYSLHKKEGGGATITLNNKYIGQTILIESAYCTYSQQHMLASWTETGKTIAIPLESTLSGTYEKRPILNFQNISVYLNGMYLVRDIDYHINDVRDPDGNLSFRELVIQTMDHFKEGINDRLDLLINVAEIEDISSGFTINNKLTDISPVNLYFPNISTVHIGGKLERNVEYRGVYIEVPNGEYPHGTIFEIQTSVPKVVKDFILRYATNEDKERIRILNEYFYSLVNLVPDVLVMERKNRIYSVFMNEFIRDVKNGEIPVVDDPDVNRMKRMIQPYFHLVKMDLCFRNLDQRFIDYYPQYVNYEVDTNMKRFIDRFVARYMPENIDPTVEVIHG